MVQSFKDKDTERIFRRERVRRFQSFEKVALRKLVLLHGVTALADLKGKGLGLEALKEDRAGQHAIRINDVWRVCFVWKDGHAHNVEIVNYH
jgi:proteic killer suppression protein